MKSLKLFKTAAYCLITVMLLSSCGIIKTNDFARQKYTNFKKAESTVNINHVIKHKKDVDIFSVAPDKKDVVETTSVITTKPSQPNITSGYEDNKETVNTTSHIKVIPGETRKVKINRSISFVKSRLVNKANTTSYNDNGDGLSLFWLVILILLIIWAIGLASGGFGLGGLINLLLLVALVLLILWLLHVV